MQHIIKISLKSSPLAIFGHASGGVGMSNVGGLVQVLGSSNVNSITAFLSNVGGTSLFSGSSSFLVAKLSCRSRSVPRTTFPQHF